MTCSKTRLIYLVFISPLCFGGFIFKDRLGAISGFTKLSTLFSLKLVVFSSYPFVFTY